MGLASIISRASLLGRPGRTLFSILGVAVGIATVVAVFTVDHVSVLSRTIWLDPGWGADFQVRAAPGDADPREELLQLEGVAGVAAFFENDVSLRPDVGPGAGQRVRVQLTALEVGLGRGLGIYSLEAGSDLEEGGGDQVLVARNLARRLAIAPGDRIWLAAPGRSRRCVDGVLQDVAPDLPPLEEPFTVAGILDHTGLGRKGSGQSVVIPYASGARMFAEANLSAGYFLRRDEAVDLEELESGLSSRFTVERNEASLAGQKADERAFRNGVRMAGLFALLLGLFVIFHTLSMSLVERVREVGTLHALGSTRAQLARIFFFEALVVAGTAGVLGIVGGLGLAGLLLYNGITTLGVTGRPVGPLSVPWGTVSALAALGVGVALAGSVWPILRVRGTNVVAALRGEEARRGEDAARGLQLFGLLALVVAVPAVFFLLVPVVGAKEAELVGTVLLGMGVLAALFALPVLFPRAVAAGVARLARPFESRAQLAGGLARRSLAGGPTRTVSSLVALALVAAAFTSLRGMTNSLAAEIEVWGEEAVTSKLWVEGLPDGTTFDALDEALDPLAEVRAIEQGELRAYVGYLLLGIRAEEVTSLPEAVEADAEEAPARFAADWRRRFERDQAALVSRRLAEQRGLDVGDALLVNTPGSGVQAFTVVGVTDAVGYFVHPDERAYAVVDARWMHAYFCLDAELATSVAVRLGPEPGDRAGDATPFVPDFGAVEALLRARFPDEEALRFTTGSDVLRLHLEDIERDFVLFDLILGLTALLAGLGVLNGLLLSALERAKEVGVLRALGTTDRQIAGAVFLESGLLGLAGGLVGYAVGLALTPVLVAALRSLSGLALPLRLAFEPGLLAVALAVLLGLAAGWVPLRRMQRMDPVRAVRTG